MAGIPAGNSVAITTSLTTFATAAKAQPVIAAAADTSARQVAPVAVKAAGYTTVRASGGLRAPNSQRFTLNRSPTGPLVDDLILALTGRRFLGGYSSTEDEYQALLDAGVMCCRLPCCFVREGTKE